METIVPSLGLGWALLGIGSALRAPRRDRASLGGFLTVTVVFAWPLAMSLLALLPMAAPTPLDAVLGLRAAPFFFGPALFGYAGIVMRLRRPLPGGLLLHALPFLVVSLAALFLPGILYGHPPLAVVGEGAGRGPASIILGTANATSVIGYGIATRARVKTFARDAGDFYSSDRGALTLRWLGALAIANLLVFGLATFVLALAPVARLFTSIKPEAIVNPAIAGFLFVFVLFAHDQPALSVYPQEPEAKGDGEAGEPSDRRASLPAEAEPPSAAPA